MCIAFTYVPFLWKKSQQSKIITTSRFKLSHIITVSTPTGFCPIFYKWYFVKYSYQQNHILNIQQSFLRTAGNNLHYIRPCQIGILLSVNSSLTNLGTYSQKHTNRKRKPSYFTTKTMHYLYIYLMEKSYL